jgi:hypothetical protein
LLSCDGRWRAADEGEKKDRKGADAHNSNESAQARRG